MIGFQQRAGGGRWGGGCVLVLYWDYWVTNYTIRVGCISLISIFPYDAIVFCVASPGEENK